MLNCTLDQLVEELQRMLVQAEADLHQADQAKEKATVEVRRLRSILRAAGLSAEQAEPREKKKEPRVPRVNEETRRMVLFSIHQRQHLGASIIPDVRGSFTIRDLHVPELHESSVRTAVNMLREEGIVRAIGKVPNSPRLAPTAYALVPAPEEAESSVG
jgi:hypothetical protein